MADDTDVSPTFNLKLDGNGISIDRPVDTSTAWRILTVVMEADGAPAPAAGAPLLMGSGGVPDPSPGLSDTGPGSARVERSLREFLDEHEPGRNVETIVAIAAYLEEQRGEQSFNREDIKKAFREASEALPGNFGRDFNWARKTGWIANMEGRRGEYYVTDSGKKAVAAKFPAELRKKTAVSKGSRKRAKSKPEAGDG